MTYYSQWWDEASPRQQMPSPVRTPSLLRLTVYVGYQSNRQTVVAVMLSLLRCPLATTRRLCANEKIIVLLRLQQKSLTMWKLVSIFVHASSAHWVTWRRLHRSPKFHKRAAWRWTWHSRIIEWPLGGLAVSLGRLLLPRWLHNFSISLPCSDAATFISCINYAWQYNILSDLL